MNSHLSTMGKENDAPILRDNGDLSCFVDFSRDRQPVNQQFSRKLLVWKKLSTVFFSSEERK